MQILFSTLLAATLCLSQDIESKSSNYNFEDLNVFSSATNRNFKVSTPTGPYFLRIGRDNPEELCIDRVSEIRNLKIAAQLGLAPQLYGYELNYGLLLCEYIQGLPPTDERLQQEEFLNELIILLHQLHGNKLGLDNSKLETVFSRNDTLLTTAQRSLDSEILLNIPKWLNCRKSFERNFYSGMHECICHGDLSRANFLESSEGRLYLVDWEFSYSGYAIDDVANLCVSNGFDNVATALVGRLYYGDTYESLAPKLAQVIFMHRFNFYLWCHIEAKKHPENLAFYMQMANDLEQSLNSSTM